MNRKEFIKNMGAAVGFAALGLGCSKEATANEATSAGGDANALASAKNKGDKKMKCAVVYYSWSGNTRFAAEAIAKKAGADLFEIKASDTDEIAGTVSIGAGETPAFRFVARAANELHRKNPKLCFSVSSGNGEDIVTHLREGTFDLGVLIGPGRYDGFDYLTLPYTHHWGLAVRNDSPLAAKKRISPKDARGIPLICSRQAMVKEFLAGWFGCPFGKLDIVANYNLIYNAAVFVEAGLGAAVCIDGMIPQKFAERVVFRPFAPALTSDVYLAWRKSAALSPAASALVETVRNMASDRQM